jgi:2-dehydro-3-deoxy-D-arabinonate dehydratase
MKIYRTSTGIVIENNQNFYQSNQKDWNSYLNRNDLRAQLEAEIATLTAVDDAQCLATQTILAPIEKQEIWAAGVTYMRSKNARMEESKDAGGGSFYDRVYDAERPEIFFKATAHRTVGPGGKVRIRQDSTWDVPEPELTLWVTSSGKIVGYTIGNDMSSRSIEGENPLYLPQAKSYDGCAALGPCVYVPAGPLPTDTRISLTIKRKGQVAFENSIGIDQMKRGHQELVSFLYRECSFPDGCFLMTGTGIVPPNDFTLQSNDEIFITIQHIGTLHNVVA